MIQSPIGPISLRAPTESEAIALEDKQRFARRPRGEDDDSSGSLFDNGLEEILSCVTSHKRSEIDPAEDGLLADYPVLFDALLVEFRRMGASHVSAENDGIDDAERERYGKKAVCLRYGADRIVVRKMTYPEYCAFTAEKSDRNIWGLIAGLGKGCILSHQGEDLAALLAGKPYLSMTVGAKILDLGKGAAETKAGKSESGSQGKTMIR